MGIASPDATHQSRPGAAASAAAPRRTGLPDTLGTPELVSSPTVRPCSEVSHGHGWHTAWHGRAGSPASCRRSAPPGAGYQAPGGAAPSCLRRWRRVTNAPDYHEAVSRIPGPPPLLWSRSRPGPVLVKISIRNLLENGRPPAGAGPGQFW